MNVLEKFLTLNSKRTGMTPSMLDINILGALSLSTINSGPQVIDKDQPIRLAKFGARAQIYKAGEIHNISVADVAAP